MTSTLAKRLEAFVAGLGVIAAAASARAQEPPPPAAPAPPETPPAAPPAPAPPKPEAGGGASAPPKPAGGAPLTSGDERPLPDYDGRPDPAPTPGEVLLWVPRAVFFPVYLVSEYLLRKPLGALTVAAERGQWVKEVTEIFTFGPNGNIGVVPTALVDFGLRSSVGVYFFYDDFLAKGNGLRVHAATGGEDWLRLTVADRVELDDRASLRFRGEAWTRPDGVYHGIGPDTGERPEFRYDYGVVAGSVTFDAKLGERTNVALGTSVRSVSFGDGGSGHYLPLRDAVAAGVVEAPPGFDDGYIAYRQTLSVAYDTRRPRPAPGHGVRVEGKLEHDFDMDDPAQTRWIEYGGSIGGYVDVTGKNRVVGLSVTALFADPLGDGEIPFPELVELGGDTMRGFRPARLYGRSATVAQLEYRWPVWAFLDGSATAAIGNVWGERLDGFDAEKLRLAFWGGLRSSASRDTSFDLLVGFGADTFEQGTHPNDVRFLFGTHQGF